jgi:hypothetical protein
VEARRLWAAAELLADGLEQGLERAGQRAPSLVALAQALTAVADLIITGITASSSIFWLITTTTTPCWKADLREGSLKQSRLAERRRGSASRAAATGFPQYLSVVQFPPVQLRPYTPSTGRLFLGGITRRSKKSIQGTGAWHWI